MILNQISTNTKPNDLVLFFAFIIKTTFLMTNNTHGTRVRIAAKKRNQKAYAKKKLKQQEAAASIIDEMQSKNLRAYHRMNLDQKYEFAFRGYVFEKYPNHLAIYLGKTNMTTEQGFDRCIRVGTAFKKLPPGFIILFSKLEVTDVMLTGDTARYQVQLNDGSFLEPHTDPCTPYGLAQFINCCLSSSSTTDWIAGQNMQTKQCDLITNLHHDLRRDYKNISPAYVKVIANIKQDDELLLPSGYGDRTRIVT